MNATMIKNTLLSISIFFVCFTFPLQVYTLSPLPALMPYCILFLLLVLDIQQAKADQTWYLNLKRPIVACVFIYLILFTFNTCWQFLFGILELNEVISAVVNYCFPVLFFFYFIPRGSYSEFKVVLISILICGMLVGFWYIYDSYAMLGLGEVSDYSIMAFEYSQIRMNTIDINDARVSAGYRSHGLLESHSISSAWIAFAGFAALSLIDKSKTILRFAVITIFLTVLIAAQNYTSIVAFVIVLLVAEFGFFKILRGVISTKMILAVVFFPLIISIIFISAADFLDSQRFIDAILEVSKVQIGFFTGDNVYDESGHFYSIISNLLDFPFYKFNNFFPGLFIGDGFGSFGIVKGGDFGLVESLHRFGLLFFIFFFGGVLALAYKALRGINANKNYTVSVNKVLWFSASVSVYLLLTEVHYSVWNAKSVLPILFICLSIFDRFLESTRMVPLITPRTGLHAKSGVKIHK